MTTSHSPTAPNHDSEGDAMQDRLLRSRWSPYWGTEDDVIELGLGIKPPHHTDEASAIEHRLCRANGLTYGCPPRHWAWSR